MTLTAASTAGTFAPVLARPSVPQEQPRPPQAPQYHRDTPPPERTLSFSTTLDDSPTPGADRSPDSSPGSASDHMGSLPSTGDLPSQQQQPQGQQGHPQAVYPGSSVLSAFEAGQTQQKIYAGMTPATTTSTMMTMGSTASSSAKQPQQQQPQPQQQQPQQQPHPPEVNRRQKRLQRNRESARLSRRRRKQYLEVLEERVNQMATDLDRRRRAHVSNAVATIHQKRVQVALSVDGTSSTSGSTSGSPTTAALLDHTNLSRTSPELSVASTFLTQQLHSFAVPPSTKFILWLTLQTDDYFRGGRAASERLSAARIGERMLSSGTDRAAPSPSMWPLFCNEIGVSYDQEEKVRSFQRQLLQDPHSWLNRHTALATRQCVQSGHEAVQALTGRLRQREATAGRTILSTDQRAKLMAWSTKNRDRVAQSTVGRVTPPPTPDRTVSNDHHVAANLYILNDRLAKVLDTVPRVSPLISGKALKKLSRRPAFESLGARDGDTQLCRDASYSSSSSLKRSASEMSIDGGEEGHNKGPGICPVDAQRAAASVTEQALGMVRDLWPPPPPLVVLAPAAAAAPMQPQLPLSNLPQPMQVPQPQQPLPPHAFAGTLPVPPYVVPPEVVPSLVYQAPAAMTQSTPVLPTHERKSSFLPAHLNVVPEEMWPADEADEFLLDMIEGDWAIGEGIDMDVPA